MVGRMAGMAARHIGGRFRVRNLGADSVSGTHYVRLNALSSRHLGLWLQKGQTLAYYPASHT